MKKIDEFKNKYFFLSNFYLRPMVYEGLTYRCAEAAFQSAKVKDKKDRWDFIDLNPSEAKRLGRKIPLRADWEEIKDEVMYQVCKSKFCNDVEMQDLLLATENALLEEGNTWGDRYWGTVNGIGKNKLGQILMKIREEIKDEIHKRLLCEDA